MYLTMACWCVMEGLISLHCCVLEMMYAEAEYLKVKGNMCQKILCINGLCVGFGVHHSRMQPYGSFKTFGLGAD